MTVTRYASYYHDPEIEPCDDGPWVRYEDYEALERLASHIGILRAQEEHNVLRDRFETLAKTVGLCDCDIPIESRCRGVAICRLSEKPKSD